MSGAFIARRFVPRLEPEMFRLVMDGIMLAAGPSLAVVGNNFIKSTSFYYSDLNHPQGKADEVTRVTCPSGGDHR
jgi:hypothetical protein